MNNKLCQHCINKPKIAKYSYKGTYREGFVCASCSKTSFFKNHYAVQLVPLNTTATRRYNLPLDHKYTLVSTSELEIDNYTSCQNCDRIINNVATVKSDIGTFDVGLDCAQTLSFYDSSDYFKVAEAEARARKLRGYISKAKKWFKAGTYSVITNDTTAWIYEKQGVTQWQSYWSLRFTLDTYKKHFNFKHE